MQYYGNDSKESFEKFVEFKDEIWDDLSQNYGFAKFSDIKADLEHWFKSVHLGDKQVEMLKYLKNIDYNDSSKLLPNQFEQHIEVLYKIIFDQNEKQKNFFKMESMEQT